MTLPSVAMKHLASIAALALFATSAALAQSSAQAPPADPQPPTAAPPVFRTGSELVRVDVRVTDDQGHPVTDLRPGEVKLEEEGKPRPVVLFQHIAAPLGTYTEAAQRTIGAEVSTNQGAPQGHIYVLVFDEVHIRSGHEQRARLAAERFLRTNVRPGDRVALYALPGPGPQIPFTADVGRVLHELPAIRGSAEETRWRRAGVGQPDGHVRSLRNHPGQPGDPRSADESGVAESSGHGHPQFQLDQVGLRLLNWTIPPKSVR